MNNISPEERLFSVIKGRNLQGAKKETKNREYSRGTQVSAAVLKWQQGREDWVSRICSSGKNFLCDIDINIEIINRLLIAVCLALIIFLLVDFVGSTTNIKRIYEKISLQQPSELKGEATVLLEPLSVYLDTAAKRDMFQLVPPAKPQLVETERGFATDEVAKALSLVGIYWGGVPQTVLEERKMDFLKGRQNIPGTEIEAIWIISTSELAFLNERVRAIMKFLEGTKYSDESKIVSDGILSKLQEIKTTQDAFLTNVQEHISRYEANISTLQGVRRDIASLEKLVVELGGQIPKVELAGAGSVEEIYDAGRGISLGMADLDIENLAKPQGIAVQSGGAPGISLGQKEGVVSDVEEKIILVGTTIFRGNIPSGSVTWTLIYWIIGFLAVVSFIFFLIQVMQHKQMVTDTLTGTYTRTYLSVRLPQELNASKAQKFNYAVLMIDIDGFKDFNDRYGHLVGDTILRETVGIVKRNLRAIDIVGRFGGDEFFIALPNMSRQETEIIAKRLVQAVAAHKIRRHVGEEELLITISVGAAVFPDDAQDYETLVKKADEALYCAKSKGGNTLCLYAS